MSDEGGGREEGADTELKTKTPHANVGNYDFASTFSLSHTLQGWRLPWQHCVASRNVCCLFQRGRFLEKNILPMEKCPIKAKGNYRTMCIPCGLHGDEVPVIGIGKIWSRSCLNFSWCSLLANACGGRCEDIMFFLWSVFEKFAIASTSTTLGTVDTFFSILKWSFLAMFQGTWPKKDWLGFSTWYTRSQESWQASCRRLLCCAHTAFRRPWLLHKMAGFTKFDHQGQAMWLMPMHICWKQLMAGQSPSSPLEKQPPVQYKLDNLVVNNLSLPTATRILCFEFCLRSNALSLYGSIAVHIWQRFFSPHT